MTWITSRLARRAAIAALLTLPMLNSAPAAPLHLDEAIARHKLTCNHYQNRARFRSREGLVRLDVLLADSCDLALSVLDGRKAAGPDEHANAADYLNRLSNLRSTVIEINMLRLYGVNAGPRSQPRTVAKRAGAIKQVSTTGEYLIARRMGVLQALEKWRRDAPEFTLALK